MRVVSSVLALVVSLSVAGAVLAQGGMGGASPAPAAPAKEKAPDKAKASEWNGPLGFLRGIDLTADQKAKLADLMKEYQPKLQNTRNVMESILTPEQKKARDTAAKEAKDAGKNPHEIGQAVHAAVTLTEEQKTKMKEAMTGSRDVYMELHKKVMDVLTDAQKEQLKKRWQEQMEKMKNTGKKPAGAS